MPSHDNTSVIVFDIAQFFLSFNYEFLFTYLKKAGLNTNVVYYESPKKKLTSYVFEHLIYNLKSYNGIEI